MRDKWRFRGFDAVGNKGWVYGDLVHNQKVTETGLEPRVMVGGYEVVSESVGLCTGYKDANGVEVYEGDIVSNKWCFGKNSIVKFGEYQHLNAQARYVNGDFGFYLYHIDDFQRAVERNDFLFYFGNTEKSEIIGNVFENKNILI